MKRNMTLGILAVAVTAVFSQLQYTQAAEQILEMNQENFEPIVLVDDENCLVTITGVETDNMWGYTWSAVLENRTDKELMYALNNVSVNGFMCDPFWAATVSAGKKANSDISWSDYTFEENGIETVEEVSFTLTVYDAEDFMADHLVESVYTINCSGSKGAEESTENKAAALAEESTSAEEIVLAETGECLVKLLEIEEGGDWGYTWNLYLENNSDKQLMFSLNNMTVNGWVCDPAWATEVAAGKKANAEVTWSEDSFSENGIEAVTEVEGTVLVYDVEDWMAEFVAEEKIEVYPMGEDAVDAFVRVPAENEIVLVDNEVCSVIVTGYEPDSMFGFAMNVYLENKTDSSMMVVLEEASVNGYMCDPFWASEIPAGKRQNAEITWYTDALEENGISEIETIEGVFVARDAENYELEPYVEETFAVEP